MLEYFTNNYINFNIATFLGDVAVAALISFLFLKITRTRKDIIRYAVSVLIVFVLKLLVSSFVGWILPSIGMVELAIVPAITIFLSALFLRGYHYIVRLVWGSILLMVILYSMSFSYLFGSILSIEEMIARGFIYNMLARILSWVCICVYLKLNSFEKYLAQSKYLIILIEIISLTGIVIEVVYIEFNGKNGIPVDNLIIVIGLLVIELSVYGLFLKLIKRNAAYVEDKESLNRMQRDYEMVKLSAKNYEELRMIRHDIKNQYSYIRVLLEQKNYDKALEYFSELASNALVPTGEISCGNKTVDNIMNFELNKAREKGISVKEKIILPADLPFRESDLCSFLTNIIDNAIENCSDENGQINISIICRDNYMFLEIANTVEKNSDEADMLSLKTKKQDKDKHGIGTKIINKIAEQYNGSIQYSVKNGIFYVNAMLALVSEDNN